MAAKHAVVGVGSPHGDDQIGWHVIDQLKQRSVPAMSLLAVSDPVDMLEHLDGTRKLIIVDACQSGSSPGSLTRLDWDDGSPAQDRYTSTHRFSLVETLRLAAVLGRLPDEVVVFGVEVAQCRPQTGLHPEVKAVVPELIRVVCEELSVDT